MKPLIIFLFFAQLTVVAQDEVKPPAARPISSGSSDAPKDFNTLRERFYVGGNVGASFGSTTYISLQPLLGFKITPKFSVGAGFTYNYYSVNYYGKRYVSTIYGSNAFVRYMILENLFAQVGWDKLSVPDYASGFNNQRRWVDNILIGGGYRQPFSSKAFFVAAIYYNINQTPYSPYANPIIQIGFNIGL